MKKFWVCRSDLARKIIKLYEQGVRRPRDIAKILHVDAATVRVYLSRYRRNKLVLGDDVLVIKADPFLIPLLQAFLKSEAFKIAFQDFVYELTYGQHRPRNIKIKIYKI